MFSFSNIIIFLGILWGIQCLPQLETIQEGDEANGQIIKQELDDMRKEMEDLKSLLAKNMSSMSAQIQQLESEKKALVNSLNLANKAIIKQETKRLQHCYEVKKQNPSAESGMYWLDPARNFIPVQIYCDMSGDGVSIVAHSNPETDIPYCKGDGCFNLSFKYTIPDDQLTALIEMSFSCQQEITFKCKMAPLKNTVFGRYYFGWWLDRNNVKRFYFNGNEENEHVCGCSQDNSCSQSIFNATCNCDSGIMPIWSQDSGVLTNKDHLPVRGFSYGGLSSDLQAAGIALGKLTCSGVKPTSTETISSCSSLKKSGVSYDGYFLTKEEEDNFVSLSYCKNSKSGLQEEALRLEHIPLSSHLSSTKIQIEDFSMQLPSQQSVTENCMTKGNDCFRNTGWAAMTNLKVTGTIGRLNVTGGYITVEKSGICLFETNKWFHIQDSGYYSSGDYKVCEIKARINNELILGSIFPCSAGDIVTLHTESQDSRISFSSCFNSVWKNSKIDLFFTQIL